MEDAKYSEQDLQDYAEGKFTGDIQAFEAYLSANPELATQVKLYQSVYSVLRSDEPVSLQFDLADKVLEKLSRKEDLKEARTFQLVEILAGFLIAVALVISYRYLGVERIFSYVIESGVFIISALGIVLFLAGFYLIEIKEIRRKLAV